MDFQGENVRKTKHREENKKEIKKTERKRI